MDFVTRIFISRLLASCVYYGTIPFVVYYAVNVGFGYMEGVMAMIVISICSDVTKYMSGALLSKFGAIRILVNATVILSLAYLSAGMIGLSSGFAYMFFGIFVGVCFGVFYVYYRVLFSYLGATTSVVNYHAYMASANNIGFVLGPLVFSIMAHLNHPDRVFLCFSSLLFLSTGLLLSIKQRIVLNTEHTFSQEKTEQKKKISFGSIYIISALYWGLLQQVMMNFALYSTLKFGTVAYASYFFSIQGIMSAMLIPVVARWMKTEDLRYLHIMILLGIGLLCFGFNIISHIQTGWLFCIFLLFFCSASQALCVSPISAVISIQCNFDQRLTSQAFGKLGLIQGIGTIIGQLAGGVFFGQLKVWNLLDYYWMFSGIFGLLLMGIIFFRPFAVRAARGL